MLSFISIVALLLLAAGVASAVDRYVDPSGGSDANGGTDPITDAWLTTQKAADTAVAGETVFLMNTATETPSAAIDFDTNAGTAALPIYFVGADSAGDALTTGYYTISGSSLPVATTLLELTSGVATYAVFQRVRITAATGDGVTANVAGLIGVHFTSCRIDNNGAGGIFWNVAFNPIYLTDAIVDHNTTKGVYQTSGDRGIYVVEGGAFYENGSHGILSGENGGFPNVIKGALFYRNTLDGFSTTGTSNLNIIDHCTFFDNGSDGIAFTSATSDLNTITNNTFVKNGGYGLNYAGTSIVAANNHYGTGADLNTSGKTNFTPNPPGQGNQEGLALFTNTTSGTEDFTPLTTSPLIRTGLNGSDIGAVAHADGGGGGGIANLIDGGLVHG